MNFWPFVIASAICTYLVRVIPWVKDFVNSLPPFLRRCMTLIPIASLGALIFPDAIITYASNSWFAGFFGVLAPFTYCLLIKKPSLLVSVIISVLATYVVLIF